MTQALSLVMLVWALSAVTITQAAQSPEEQPLRLAVVVEKNGKRRIKGQVGRPCPKRGEVLK
ncbi:MAG: hypothetical protein QGI24_01785 [Kiritimatiellia bacterium]|jgi:hypothetical protein|nr:hypothetical protein [Kiritimatiellia bacterium]MDP6847494.1 hypothetical protein [Kiritimatiellia bacterium]